MNITLKPKDKNSNNAGSGGEGNSKGDFTEMAFFVALNVLVLPFSAYQTFVGYQADVAGNVIAALALAVISAVLFAAMNFGIRNRRLQGKSVVAQSLMYIIPLGISLPANFNAFYSNIVRDQLFDQGIAEYEAVLIETRDNAMKQLEDCGGWKPIEEEYALMIGQLKDQFDGKAQEAPGWGSACKDQWKDIEQFCKEKDPYGKGIVNSPGSGSDAYENAKNISGKVIQTIVSQKQEEMAPYFETVQTLSNPVFEHIKDVKDNDKFKDEGKSLLDEIVSANNLIGSKVDAALVDCGGFQYTKLKPSESNRESTIEYSLQSAFVDKPSPSATYFSLFLAGIIDFAALLYILFFVKSGKQKVQGRVSSGPRSIN